MNRLLTDIAIGSALCVCAHALADESSQSKITKQQMIVQIVDCVKKRVATRTVSYNDALKTCKDQLKEESATAPPEGLLASGAEGKP